VKEFVRYGIAVCLYIALSLVTKRFLTWTWGPIYFIVVLEVVPRLFNRLRHGPAAPEPFGPLPRPTEAIAES